MYVCCFGDGWRQCPGVTMPRSAQIESVFLNCPNLHFIPCNPVTSSFKDDVYVATSEPHGNIECVVTRKGAQPHLSKL